MSAQNSRNARSPQGKDSAQGVSIPAPIRVGGAFMALALVLVIMAIVAVFTDGWMAPFEWTYGRLGIVLAALIVGAFATIRHDQKSSITQVVALGIAVALIIASRFLPQTVLMVQAQYWLLLYAGAAALCALVIRRAMIPKA